MVGFRVVGCRVVDGSRSMIGSGSRSVVGGRRGRMVGSRGRGVVRGRSMVGSLGVRVLALAGVVALGDVVRADLTLVLDIGVILLILVNVVVDNLGPAVGKLDLVLT